MSGDLVAQFARLLGVTPKEVQRRLAQCGAALVARPEEPTADDPPMAPTPDDSPEPEEPTADDVREALEG